MGANVPSSFQVFVWHLLKQEASNLTSTILVFFFNCMPTLYLSCLLIYCIPFLLSYFGIVQSIQSFCIYWELIYKKVVFMHCGWEGGKCVYKIRLFKKLDYHSDSVNLRFFFKWKSHKHWCPFQTISLVLPP